MLLPDSVASASQPTRQPSKQSSPGFTVHCEDRWQVYHRLQELDIACQCKGFQPLKADIRTASEALQLWSIIRRVSQPRQILVDTLDRSWRQPCGKPLA